MQIEIQIFNWSRKCIPRKNSFCSHCACGCCRWGHFGSCCKSSVCELIQVSYGTRRRTSLYLNGNAGKWNRSLTWLNVSSSAKNSISYYLELITSPKDGRLFVCFRLVPCVDDQFWSLTKFPFSWLFTINDQRIKCVFYHFSNFSHLNHFRTPVPKPLLKNILTNLKSLSKPVSKPSFKKVFANFLFTAAGLW